MNTWHATQNTAYEDDFFDYLDRLVAGENPQPRNDIEATAARVQRALRTRRPVPRNLPAGLKTSIWEEVMRSTATAAAPKARRASSRPPATLPLGGYTRRSLGQFWMWTGHIALALLLILSAYGVARGFGRLGSSDTPINQTTIGSQLATPATTVTASAQASAATPGAQTGCDISGDIPIIPDLVQDTPPLGTTSLYIVKRDRTSADPRGDLKLGCAGQPSVTLAKDVVSAWPGPWPAIVTVTILPQGLPASDESLAMANTAYVNIITGESITFGSSMNAPYSVPGSPWVFGPLAEEPTAMAVADLRTMDTRPLAEVGGANFPPNAGMIMSEPAEDGTVAVMFAGVPSYSAPGKLLLLGDSFADARWITLPEPFTSVSEVSLSPNGTYAVVTSSADNAQGALSHRYGLIDITNDSVIAVFPEITTIGEPSTAWSWIRGGQALAYLDGSRLVTMLVEGNEPPQTVFEAPSPLVGLQTTRDPNIVVVVTRRDHGSDAPANQTDRDAVYAVNVVTGAVNEFSGIDASTSASWIRDAVALVMYEWDDSYPDTTTYHVFDPVTGVEIGTISDAPSAQPRPRTISTIGRHSIAVSENGRVEAIGLLTNNIYMFTEGPEGLAMRRLDPPEGLLSSGFLTANVVLSPDGTKLSLTGEEDESRTRYLISLDDPQAGWITVPNSIVGNDHGIITFVATGR